MAYRYVDCKSLLLCFNHKLLNKIDVLILYSVDQGWRVHVPSLCFVGGKYDNWQKIVRKIKNWMCSWMRPGFVENDMEYKTSVRREIGRAS